MVEIGTRDGWDANKVFTVSRVDFAERSNLVQVFNKRPLNGNDTLKSNGLQHRSKVKANLLWYSYRFKHLLHEHRPTALYTISEVR